MLHLGLVQSSNGLHLQNRMHQVSIMPKATPEEEDEDNDGQVRNHMMGLYLLLTWGRLGFWGVVSFPSCLEGKHKPDDTVLCESLYELAHENDGTAILLTLHKTLKKNPSIF